MTKEVKEEKKELEIPAVTRILPPHTKKSRTVITSDLPRLVKEAQVLYEICFSQMGMYMGAFAMHHSQIDDKDPLNFFVRQDRKIIINPKIVRHSGRFTDSKEGCISFPVEVQITVPRWYKVEVEYISVVIDPEDEKKFKLSGIIKESLKAQDSFIYQHEMDHGDAKFIYPLVEKKNETKDKKEV